MSTYVDAAEVVSPVREEAADAPVALVVSRGRAMKKILLAVQDAGMVVAARPTPRSAPAMRPCALPMCARACPAKAATHCSPTAMPCLRLPALAALRWYCWARNLWRLPRLTRFWRAPPLMASACFARWAIRRSSAGFFAPPTSRQACAARGGRVRSAA